MNSLSIVLIIFIVAIVFFILGCIYSQNSEANLAKNNKITILDGHAYKYVEVNINNSIKEPLVEPVIKTKSNELV